MHPVTKPLLLSLLLLFLSACATPGKKELTADEMKSRLESSRVIVQWVETPAPLVEETKSQAVGNFIISSVLASAVGSTAPATSNPNTLQANMEIAQSIGEQIHSTLPKGTPVNGGDGIDHILVQKLATYFKSWNPQTQDSPEDIQLSVRALRWQLGYLSLLTSSDYGLNYHLQIQARTRQAEGPGLLKTVNCHGDFAETMPLESWQAENYKAVSIAANEVADTCLQQVLSEIGLTTDIETGEENKRKPEAEADAATSSIPNLEP